MLRPANPRFWVVMAAALIALPACAQTYNPVFSIGQLVKDMGATESTDPDSACASARNLQQYMSASDACGMGDAGSCSVAKNLEDSGACGPTFHMYVVLAVSQDLIEISPVQDRSRTYWAHANDFTAAQ
jgi:hypothetical protein